MKLKVLRRVGEKKKRPARKGHKDCKGEKKKSVFLRYDVFFIAVGLSVVFAELVRKYFSRF